MKLARASLQSMKKINCSLILHMLLKERSLSRAEIAQMTKLSATTVSSLVDEMIQVGIIEEVGEKRTTGVGRKDQFRDKPIKRISYCNLIGE